MMTVSTPAAEAALDRLERDAGRVGALGAAHDLDTDPLAPGRELLDRRRAERVGRAERHGAVLGDQDPRDLADGRGLAGAVDAHHEHHAGGAVGSGDLQPAVHAGVDEADQLFAQHALGVRGVPALDPQPGAQALDQLLGGRDTDVGGQQGVLDGLPGVLVEAVAAEQREQPAPEPALRAGEPLAQPHQRARPCSPASRGRAPPRRRTTSAGGAMTSAGRARRRLDDVASPPSARRGTDDEADDAEDDNDGDADDQVEPVTHGAIQAGAVRGPLTSGRRRPTLPRPLPRAWADVGRPGHRVTEPRRAGQLLATMRERHVGGDDAAQGQDHRHDHDDEHHDRHLRVGWGSRVPKLSHLARRPAIGGVRRVARSSSRWRPGRRLRAARRSPRATEPRPCRAGGPPGAG